MPLSFLGELLDFAVAEEKRKQEAEDKKQLTKLWLAQYIVKRIAKQKPMEYEEFMRESLKTSAASHSAKTQSKNKTAEEILAEFAPIIERDSLKE